MIRTLLKKENFLKINILIKIFLFPIITLLLIIKNIFSALLNRFFERTNIFERLFVIFSMLLFLLTVSPWLHYTVAFELDYIVDHKVYTDEFLILFICIITALSPFLINFFLATENYYYKIGFIIIFYIIRVVALSIISFIFAWSLQEPEIISLSKTAKFTWQFFGFGFILIFSWIWGLLGLKSLRSASLRI